MNNLQQRRYEILLPQRFNDGAHVPEELFAETLLELRRQFQAVSSETSVLHGTWQHLDEVYRDDLVRIFVDVDDSSENRDFFREFKEVLKARFRQLDIRITSFLVDVY